jgi:DNA-directed RNA polymerase subunit M/transcription elongation factor TFIIS
MRRKFGGAREGSYIYTVNDNDKIKVMKCYKNKITYWQNRLNKAINCAPCDYSEKNIERALSSLTYFVNKQVEVDFPPLKPGWTGYKQLKASRKRLGEAR